MKTLIAATLALVCMLLTVPVGANGDSHHVTIALKDFEFSIDGGPKNGDLRLQPGETYEFSVTNEGQQGHDWNLDVDGDGVPEASTQDVHTGLVTPGQSVVVTYTVPVEARGTGQYWCNPHASKDGTTWSGMSGDVIIDSGSSNGAPGPGLLLVLAGIAAAVLVSRR